MSPNYINTRGQQVATACMVLIAAVGLTSNQASGQFLQPQSHLGRLVQSITSPLVGYPSSEHSGDSYDSAAGPSSGAASDNSPDSDQRHLQHYQSYERQQPLRGQHQHQHQHRPQAMQQAPSQQRGVPQQYYGGGAGEESAGNQDEDSGAPSNPRQQQAQEYQMGAYLGPTIDDKEINGAFNSNNNNNNNDDDDGYDEGGRQRAASGSPGYASGPGSLGPFYGPAGGLSGATEAGYGPAPSGRQHESSYRPAGGDESAGAFGPLSDDDESGADEDEQPRGARPSQRGRAHSNGLSQAASYHQQRHQRQQEQRPRGAQRAQQQAGLMAAANGYAPYGYAGPIDLNGILAAAQGDPNAGYQVYQGDGGYPGGQAGYYGRGGRRQAAGSMNNPYGYGQMGGQANQEGQQNDNDDQDNDNDDD